MKWFIHWSVSTGYFSQFSIVLSFKAENECVMWTRKMLLLSFNFLLKALNSWCLFWIHDSWSVNPCLVCHVSWWSINGSWPRTETRKSRASSDRSVPSGVSTKTVFVRFVNGWQTVFKKALKWLPKRWCLSHFKILSEIDIQ